MSSYKSTIWLRIKQVVYMTIVLYLVFYLQGHPLQFNVIYSKLSNPSTILLVEDVLYYWWDILIFTSIILNHVSFNAVQWFRQGLNSGTVRVGGNAAND